MKQIVLLVLLSVAIMSSVAIGQESNNTSSSYNGSSSYSNVPSDYRTPTVNNANSASDYRTPVVSSANNVTGSTTPGEIIEDGNRSRVAIKIYRKQGEFPIFEVGIILLMVILASAIYVTKIKKK